MEHLCSGAAQGQAGLWSEQKKAAFSSQIVTSAVLTKHRWLEVGTGLFWGDKMNHEALGTQGKSWIYF